MEPGWLLEGARWPGHVLALHKEEGGVGEQPEPLDAPPDALRRLEHGLGWLEEPRQAEGFAERPGGGATPLETPP